MAFYESTFIARQELSRNDAQRLTDTFSEIVVKNGGKVIKSEYWGLRSLAYRVQKNRKGHYVMLGIEAPPSAISELDRNFRINEEIMRSMTIRVETMTEEPSVMMQRTARDESGEFPVPDVLPSAIQ